MTKQTTNKENISEEIITIKKLELPNEFRKEGLLRRLVKFESGKRDVAIYEVIKENWKFGSGHRGWEVMQIRYTTKDQEYFGSITPKGTPHLPSNEEFGTYGWHYLKYESALKKFNELKNTPLRESHFKKKYVFI